MAQKQRNFKESDYAAGGCLHLGSGNGAQTSPCRFCKGDLVSRVVGDAQLTAYEMSESGRDGSSS